MLSGTKRRAGAAAPKEAHHGPGLLNVLARSPAAREGCGDSDRRTALLFLAGRLVINRGELAEADLAAVRQAGLCDAEITSCMSASTSPLPQSAMRRLWSWISRRAGATRVLRPPA